MAVFTKEQQRAAEELRAMMSPKLLTKLVLDCGIFATINPGDEGAMTLRNYALSLLYELGMIQDKNIEHLIDTWFKMDYTVHDSEEE